MAKRPRRFPSRSVMTIVTGLPSDVAAEAACCRIVCTSVEVRLVAVANDGGFKGKGDPGVGTAPASSGGPPPTSPIPLRTRLLDSVRYLILTSTSPVAGRTEGTRITTDESQGLSGTGS